MSTFDIHERVGEIAGSQDRLAGVDGLRAVAMTMVIAQHSGLLPFGWTGVWLFFVISGYVITRGFLAEEAPGRVLAPTGQRFSAFVRRRLLRIVPVYALYLGVCFLIFAVPYGVAGMSDLAGLLTFTYNWQMSFQPENYAAHWPTIAHLWTLSVEQQFYVIYPLLILFAPRHWRWNIAAALVVLGPLTRWLWVLFLQAVMPDADPGKMAFNVYASTISQIDAFLMGALVARFQPQLLSDRRLAVRYLFIALGVAALYVAVYIGVNYGRGDRGVSLIKHLFSGVLYRQGRELFVYSVVDLVAASVLLATLAGLRWTNWLSRAWVTWTGRVSYGGYLFHVFVMWGLAGLFGMDWKEASIALRVPMFFAVLAITVGLASLSFIYFEQPIARRFKAWAKGRSYAPAMPLAEH